MFPALRSTMELEPSPTRIARVALRRHLDQLPYATIAHTFAEEGLVTPPTLRTWLEQAAHALAPLLQAMWSDASRQPYLACDVVELGVDDTLWLIVTPSDHVLFSLDRERIRAMLREFDGFYVGDSMIVDEHLERSNPIDHPWVTTRRKFLDTLDSDPELARIALAKIAGIQHRKHELGLIANERSLRRMLVERLCQPLVLDFLEWCTRCSIVHGGRGIGSALHHVQRHRAELEFFFRDARDLVNPPRARPRVFEGEIGCTFLSLFASCRAHGLEPERYLHDLLLLFPSWPPEHALSLAPASRSPARRS